MFYRLLPEANFFIQFTRFYAAFQILLQLILYKKASDNLVISKDNVNSKAWSLNTSKVIKEHLIKDDLQHDSFLNSLQTAVALILQDHYYEVPPKTRNVGKS